MVIPGNRKENFVSALQDYFCGGVGLAQTSPTYKHFNSYFDMKRYKQTHYSNLDREELFDGSPY